VGEYSVLGLIGAGGMGEVYRARDARLGRDIAIKLLPPWLLDDPAARARFDREARAVAALNHPNVVTIHEVGDYGDHPFIAFELVAGETLRERIARGPLTVSDTLAIALPIAEGLRHAHERGILHRDLKPQNIMVRPDGQVKILDFGLGKFVNAAPVAEDVTTTFRSSATESGKILGTLGYTAPEHLQGRPVDARSDQFAFGAIVYEMLTGRRAFAKETPFQTLSAIVEDEPTSLAALVPRVPSTVAAIVTRCLKKHPEQRFATSGELVLALRSVGNTARSRVATVRRFVMAAVLAIVMVAAGVTGSRWLEQSHLPALVSTTQRRLAVLPFMNIDGGTASQAFADGLAELLTTRLSGFERSNRNLLIIAATELRRDGVTNARDAQRTFRATHVVSGALQRAQNRIRLTLNLIDTTTFETIRGEVIDGEAIAGEAIDALALQDAAVTALGKMLGLQVDRAVTRATAVPGVYDYYVRGRGYLQRFERADDVDSAIKLFTLAIQRDPGFALGHAALGEAYWRKYELTRDPAFVANARGHVKDAVARDPDSAWVHISSGIVARGTGAYENAVTELNRALALDSTNADAYRELGIAYEALEKYADAEATYLKAIDSRPGDWSMYGAFGRFLAARRRYPEALEQFQHVLELTPDNARAYSNIGGIHLYLGQYDKAELAFKNSVNIRRTPEALSNLGTYYFGRGRFPDAAQAFQQSAELNGNNYRIWGNLGSAYQWVPDPARSVKAFEKAIDLAKAELRVDQRNAEILADLADFSQAVGRRSEARQFAGRAQRVAPDASVVLFKVAVVYEGLGDRKQALALLTRAVGAGYPVSQIESSRSLSALRTDPAYPLATKR
jgi:tetratricopeptide (TPR) repeat protein